MNQLTKTITRRAVRIWRGLGADSSLTMLSDAVYSRLFRHAAATAQNTRESAPAERALRAIPLKPEHAGTIPRIVFQTWKTRELPPNYAYWSATFRKINPTYQHVVWDDGDNREFIATEYPWFLPYYDGYPREIFRADIVRLFFLFHFGGLYADLDTECVRPLDSTLSRADIVLGRMGRDTTFCHSIPNAMMASAPGQLFWLLAIAMAIERIAECGGVARVNELGPEQLAGSVLLKDATDYYVASSADDVRRRAEPVLRHVAVRSPLAASRVLVLDPPEWYPVDWNNPIHRFFRREMLVKRFIPEAAYVKRLFPKSSLVTYWTHSW